MFSPASASPHAALAVSPAVELRFLNLILLVLEQMLLTLTLLLVVLILTQSKMLPLTRELQQLMQKLYFQVQVAQIQFTFNLL